MTTSPAQRDAAAVADHLAAVALRALDRGQTADGLAVLHKAIDATDRAVRLARETENGLWSAAYPTTMDALAGGFATPGSAYDRARGERERLGRLRERLSATLRAADPAPEV